MSLSFLESFDAPQPRVETPPSFSEEEIAAARQEGYSGGYAAGWETATTAAAEDRSRITSEFAAHLQELGFTFHEARAHVMKGIEPLLRELLGTLLPAVMVDAVGHTILQEIIPLAGQAANVPVAVAVAPEDADRLRAILGEQTPIPIRIDEDPALTTGQADLRLGKAERLIDLSGVLARITNSLGAVEELNERTLAHG